MSRKSKIIYWIATVWLALGMLSTGIVQLLRVKTDQDFTAQLGYPEYVLTLLGVWKIMGVIVLLLPRFPLLKEWAYAGFFFAMTGAVFSRFAMHQPIQESAPALLLLVLTIVSWYFRPAERKPLLVRA